MSHDTIQSATTPTVASVGHRLLRREAQAARAGGLTIARSVAERRRPKRLAAVTRLSAARAVAGRAAASPPGAGAAGLATAEAPPAIPRPDGMSQWAAQWM